MSQLNDFFHQALLCKAHGVKNKLNQSVWITWYCKVDRVVATQNKTMRKCQDTNKLQWWTSQKSKE